MKARLFNYLVTFVIICLAGWAAWSLYQQYVQNPWTRDSQVRANIVGIAPRVSGPIIHVSVHDNQEVKTGDMLFEIDPADYEALLNVASGQVLNAEANLKQQKQNLDRQYDLYSKHGGSEIKPQLHKSFRAREWVCHEHEYERGHLRHRRKSADGACRSEFVLDRRILQRDSITAYRNRTKG